MYFNDTYDIIKTLFQGISIKKLSMINKGGFPMYEKAKKRNIKILIALLCLAVIAGSYGIYVFIKRILHIKRIIKKLVQ